MTIPARLSCALVFGLVTVAATHAESLASSASSAGSASVGSISDSLRGSSNSSNGDRNRLADGEYRIIDVTASAENPQRVQLRMQPVASDQQGEIVLELPRAALGSQGMAAGDVVSARQRPYGYEFARAATREPFFLVLADDWKHDLDPRPVGL